MHLRDMMILPIDFDAKFEWMIRLVLKSAPYESDVKLIWFSACEAEHEIDLRLIMKSVRTL
jgi:hypothetical protein